MKKRKNAKKKTASTEIQRRPAVIALALVILAIGAISAVSKQLVAGKQSADNTTSTAPNAKKLASVKVAGQDVPLDSQTGKVRPLNAQEAEQLAQGLKKMLNKSADGLTEVPHADGTVEMDLEGRFRHVVVARENEDGTVTQSCVDNPKSAAAALGVNPKLLGADDTPTLPAARPKN